MTRTGTHDQVRFRRPRFVPGVELVSVAYRCRSFPEHSHKEYVVGVVSAGAETLSVGGTPHLVAAGSVLRLHPDEAHANATIGAETLRYDVAYLPAPAVRTWLDRDGTDGSLVFDGPVLRDPAAYATVRDAHALLAADSGALEQESALAALVGAMASAGSRGVRAKAASPATIALARAYIDGHFADAFGLRTLSELTGLSVFHLVRSFKKAVGLSPLAYRNQQRVVAARAMLLDGAPIAQVALAVGYADQSHLTRQFQRIVGVAPGRYAQQ